MKFLCIITLSHLATYKSFVVGGLHEFEDVIAGVVIFVVDLGVTEEAGVSPLFEDCCGDI